MKFKYLYPFFVTFITLLSVSFASAQNSDAVNSKLASGHWVKIKVDADGVYGFTDARLKELGFADPSKVKVFGYDPIVLVNHNPQLTPVDLPVVPSVYTDGQLLFYLEDNVDIVTELWSNQNTQLYSHQIHVHSHGATYFLSDIDCDSKEIPVISCEFNSELPVLDSHSSVIYFEDEAKNYSDGGVWFCGEAFTTIRPSETHTLKLRNIANVTNAEMFYTGILSPETRSTSNYISASYNNLNVVSQSGSTATALDAHDMFKPAMRKQVLEIPTEHLHGDLDVDVTFAVNPNASDMLYSCALDYFMFKYDRLNDVTEESQLLMYLKANETSSFSLKGINEGEWKVWDVTKFSEIKEYKLDSGEGADEESQYGVINASTTLPNRIIAFRCDVSQVEPNVLGEVNNQNLHAISVPDLLIVTSDNLLSAAEVAADFHRQHQGFDVAIVDQQDIFNEYSSGNISPEAVRGFVNDLYNRQPSKLKAILLVGQANFRNAQTVKEGSSVVVSNQSEDFSKSMKSTHNFCNDAFFGYIGGPLNSGRWASRNKYYRLYGNVNRLPVGRLPFSSIEEVRAYYRKATTYIENPPTYPAIGNLILASDYAPAVDASHTYDAYTLKVALDEKADTLITVTHAASNMYSTANNTVTRLLVNSALQRGALMFAYFGHGAANQISGTNTTADFLIHSKKVDVIKSPSKYPLYFFGSCYVGAFDQFQENLSSSLLKYEGGGPIAVIASSRSVYQPENRTLGQAVVRSLYSAENMSYMGQVWVDALTFDDKSSLDYICNQLSYNYLGDPLLPIYSATNNVDIASVNNSANVLYSGALNSVKGTVTDADGNIDTGFNGKVLLTVYDTPVNLPNLASTSGSTPHSTYMQSILSDCYVIGEYYADVKKGEFTLEFIGPQSTSESEHRLQVYVYSENGDKRGLGQLCHVDLDSSKAEEKVPNVEPVSIISFVAGDGSSDELFGSKIELNAEFIAPAGLANATSVLSPVRLTIDGVARTDVTRLLEYKGNNKYGISYPISNLTLGRHTATLYINDANGDWAEANVEFVTFIAPKVSLSASISESIIDFAVASEISDLDSCTLIIETLSGEPVQVVRMESVSCQLELDAGAYRAYVQVESMNSVSSSEKIELFVE